MNIFKFVLVLALSGVSLRVWAWGDIGHGAVGYIAEKNLTPKAKALVYDIIGIESLAISAVWPDQARSDARFKDFAEYHYIEVPQPFTFSTLPENTRASKDAHTIIGQAPDLLVNPKISREQKMILFRFLVHVVGDVHQPLHIGNGTDRGAGLCSVKWKNPKTNLVLTTSLHTAWDENLIDYIAVEFQKKSPSPLGAKRWFGYKELGELILNEGEAAFKVISQAKPSDWYNESQNLHGEAYPDGGVKVKPQDRGYCKEKPNKIPFLDAAYVANALPIIKKRILYAGYRLAGVINKMAESASLMARTLDDDKKVLDAIMLKNSKK